MPVGNDEAIDADFSLSQLHPRESCIFRNAFQICERVSIPAGVVASIIRLKAAAVEMVRLNNRDSINRFG